MDSGNRFELPQIITKLENLHDQLEDIQSEKEDNFTAIDLIAIAIAQVTASVQSFL